MILPSSNIRLANTYDEAWLYCACSTEDGYSDWRMPTSNEIDSCRRTEKWEWEWCWHEDTHYRHSSTKSKIIPIRTTRE